jgi:hypothetical protein
MLGSQIAFIQISRRVVMALLLLLPSGLMAQFSYYTYNGGITITGYTGPGGEVTIPGAIEGKPVTVIGGAAFEAHTDLTSVTIPNSVVSIEIAAFRYCSNLTNVIFGNGITYIGSGAFSQCDKLPSIAFPSCLTNIDLLAFELCTNLTEMDPKIKTSG